MWNRTIQELPEVGRRADRSPPLSLPIEGDALPARCLLVNVNIQVNGTDAGREARGACAKQAVLTRVFARPVETCGKRECLVKRVLTISAGLVILVGSLEATLLDRGGRTNAL